MRNISYGTGICFTKTRLMTYHYNEECWFLTVFPPNKIRYSCSRQFKFIIFVWEGGGETHMQQISIIYCSSCHANVLSALIFEPWRCAAERLCLHDNETASLHWISYGKININKIIELICNTVLILIPFCYDLC